MEGVLQGIRICGARSMGGILTKEMLAKAKAPVSADHHRQLAATAAGLVFYACPHNGTWLADIGWTLRFVGASPAASVLHLRAGPHLEVSLSLPSPSPPFPPPPSSLSYPTPYT